MVNIEIPHLFDNVIPQRNDNCKQNVKSSIAEDINHTPKKLNFKMLVSTCSNISLLSCSWGASKVKMENLSHF